MILQRSPRSPECPLLAGGRIPEGRGSKPVRGIAFGICDWRGRGREWCPSRLGEGGGGGAGGGGGGERGPGGVGGGGGGPAGAGEPVQGRPAVFAAAPAIDWD